MMFLVRRFLLFTVLVLPLGAWAQSKWIWDKDARQPGTSIEFSQPFELSGHVVGARLQAVADFSSLDIRINGKLVGQSPAHGPLLNLEVADHLLKGNNLVSITARSSGKAPAVALRLDWTDAKGGRGSVFSNEKWKSGKGTIESFGSLSEEPWWNLPPLSVDSLDDYTQWKRASAATEGTDPSTFFTLPGYEVELLRSAGKEENSWVSMAFDPKGRITIGREDKGLLRFSFSGIVKKSSGRRASRIPSRSAAVCSMPTGPSMQTPITREPFTVCAIWTGTINLKRRKYFTNPRAGWGTAATTWLSDPME
jgi:hypothetical protein